MALAITPIFQPAIDWKTFIKCAELILGYNPIKAAEAHDRKLSEPAKLLAVLSAFKDRNNDDPLACIRDAGSLLSHLKYGFLVAADRNVIFEISTSTNLDVTPNDTVDGGLAAVVSGTLAEWRAATLELCSPGASMQTRTLMDHAILHFEKFGLGEVWSDQRKVMMKDKTFKLEYKGTK